MTHWIRFEHAGVVNFGTLTDNTISLHEGDIFNEPCDTGVELRLEEVTSLIPIAAGKMIALWNNSRAMAEKLKQATPTEPLYFIKANGCYIGTQETIRKPPSYAGKVVFEGELGIVIGRKCRVVSKDESSRYIFGYTCINDITAVELIGKDSTFQQWTRAKSFDTFGAVGPVVTTGLDPAHLSIRTVVNGQERQHYPVSDLIFQPAEIVSALSQDMTLDAGDIICCGTSVGVGSMKPGTVVEVTIEGIGTLRNQYVD